MEPKTYMDKYNQHKIQHAAHSQHGSSRINRTQCTAHHTHRSSRINRTLNVSLTNNTDQSVKIKHNIQLTTHRDQAESTEHRMCHSWTIHISQSKQKTTHRTKKYRPRHNTKFMTNAQYWSQTREVHDKCTVLEPKKAVGHALACFLWVNKKKPHPYINLARSTTMPCGHVVNINTMKNNGNHLWLYFWSFQL